MNAVRAAGSPARSPRPCTGNVLLVVAVFVLMLSLSAGAESGFPTGWVCFDGLTVVPTPPGINIVSSGSSELVVRIETPGVLSTAVQEIGFDFRKLEFPAFYRSDEVGHPALPAVRQLVAVPSGCAIGVSVSTPDSVRYSNSVVYPVPEIVTEYTEEGYEYLVEEFAYDEDAYSMRGYYPTDVASISYPGVLRGQGLALLTVYPIQFNAADDLIRALPVVTVTLTFSGGSGGVSGDLGPFDSIAESVLLNYDGQGARGGRAQADTGRYWRSGSVAACDSADYLMIVQDSLYASAWIDTLAAHRASWNGYNVAIVSDDVLGAEISDEAIRDFIQDVYELGTAEHMSDGHLGYVLLVGDARAEEPNAYMPAHEEILQSGPLPREITTDHWYACVDDDGSDDDYADLMIGRLCASNATELQIEVERYVGYERGAVTSTSPSWRDTVLLSCGFAWLGWTPDPESQCDQADSGKANITHAAFDSVSSLVQDRYEVQEVHAHDMPGANCIAQYGQTRPLNVQLINEGCHIVEFCCHGWPLGMLTFYPQNVEQLENATELPFWISYACGSGAYDMLWENSRDCLGERLLHQEEDTGAIAYFGASEGSQTSVSKFLGKYVWEGILNEHHYEIGQFLLYAKLKDFSKKGDIRQRLMYNLLGDPALNLQLTGHHGYGSAPDYVLCDADLSACQSSPDTITFSAVVHNNSNYDPEDPVDVSFEVCERDWTGCTCIEATEVWPEAWGSEETSIRWATSQSDVGHRALRVVVDPEDEQEELFEDNNEAGISFGVSFDHSGFPIQMGGSVGLSPTFADLTDDPGLEIIASVRDPARLRVMSGNGDSLWQFERETSVLHAAPAVADLNADGVPELVFTCGEAVLALDADGNEFWEAQVEGVTSGVAVGDFDFGEGDGLLEVALERYVCGLGNEYHVVSVTSGGQPLADFQANVGSFGTYTLESSPAIADVNADGRVDMVSSFPKGGGYSGHLLAVDGQTGEKIWEDQARYLGQWGSNTDPAIQPCSPLVADVVADSAGVEVLTGGHALKCFTSDGVEIESWSRDMCGFLAGLAAVDLDSDGDAEVVATTYGEPGDPGASSGCLYVLDDNEGAWSVCDSILVDYPCVGQPAVADLDGDGDPEFIVASSLKMWCGLEAYYESHVDILTFDMDTGSLVRQLLNGRPLYFKGRLAATPAVVDTDADGYLEIWLTDGEGYIHRLGDWDTGNALRWSCYQHDERNTGIYEMPLSGAYAESSEVSWWGDYLLTGDVLIDSTSTLMIQPGTTVRVAQYTDDADLGIDPDLTELIINGGVLDAQGTLANRIRFIPGIEGTGSGVAKWRGIRLTGGSEGELVECTLGGAYKVLGAVNADLIRAERCTVENFAVFGIYCVGNSGQATVTIRNNTIQNGHIGIEMHSCAATVDSNEIVHNKSYGIKVYTDYGSTIESNVIQEPSGDPPFSGIYINGSRDTLRVRSNALSGIQTYGITHWIVASGRDEITGNHIAGDGVCNRGMYFYDSNAIVRENTLATMNIPFWVDNYEGSVPDLGDVSVSDGLNVVEGTKSTQYYVKVIGSLHTVMAENNYWGTSDPDSNKFFGPVDYTPYLSSPPGRGEQEEADLADAPLVFELAQNRPNPFNPTTTFTFSVPRSTHVRLRVYDLAGRHVMRLVDAVREPGRYAVEWDGRNANGHNVASGVYFCRMEAGSFKASRKVVILK